MSHKEQREFFAYAKDLFPEYFNNVSVIEMGSLNINGTVRDFYNATKYIGVDLEDGPGVNLICEAQNVDFQDGSFDVAVSAECFEHNPYWAETFANMHRLASKFVIFTCASDGRPEHGTRRSHPDTSPFTLDWDYYRNLNEQDFRGLFDIDSMFDRHEFIYNPNSQDLYFWGII
jgi:SAM-dependent methyltransferase